MTIKEYTESFVSKRDFENLALRNFIEWNRGCDEVNTIRNILCRANIHSINDLYQADEERIKAIKHYGTKRFEEIMKLKSIIEQKLIEGE